MVSSGLAYHTAVTAATTANLATITGGVITYTQPNGVANGVGAKLTTTTSFNLIDSANVQTVGTRILVKNEGNAVYNGVYTWANATSIVRSTDADEYGPNSSEQLSLNDYFFVTGGVTNEGSAWVVDSPTGIITFGTSNISFAQFSQTQVYEANASAGLSLIGTTFSAKVDNITTAFDGTGNIIVKASANLTTPNIGAATGTSLTTTANVAGGNLTTGGVVTATGNIQGGNLVTGGLVTATGNITSVANVAGGNILTAGIMSSTGNAIHGNIQTAGLITATGNITSVANVAGGNILTAGIMSSTGNAIHGNVNTAGLVSATGNVLGGNIISAAQSQAANLIITGAISTPSWTTTGVAIRTTASTYTDSSTLASGTAATNHVNVLAAPTIAGANLTQTTTAAATLYIAGGPAAGTNMTITNSYALYVAAGNVVAVANITGGNLLTSGLVSSTGNVVGGNINTAGLVTATGNVFGGNINTGGLVSATGNIISAGNVSGGNVLATTGMYVGGVSVLTVNSTVDGGTY